MPQLSVLDFMRLNTSCEFSPKRQLSLPSAGQDAKASIKKARPARGELLIALFMCVKGRGLLLGIEVVPVYTFNLADLLLRNAYAVLYHELSETAAVCGG